MTDSTAPAGRILPANHPVTRFAAAVIFVTLAFGLVVPYVVGVGYFLLAALAIVWLTWQREWLPADLTTYERLLLFSVVFYVVVWMTAWTIHAAPEATGAVDRTLRLLLIIPIYLFVRRIDGLERAWWRGLTGGAIIAGLYAFWFVGSGQEGQFQFRVEGTTNPIYFGGIALIMGVMLLPRVSDGEVRIGIRLIAAFAVFMALAASALSGSRGAWLGIPIVLLIYLWTLGNRQPPLWRFGIPAILLAMTIAVMLLPHSPLIERTAIGLFELIALAEGRVAGDSIGVRVQIWQLALQTAVDEFPWGGGPLVYQDAMVEAVAAGRLDANFLLYRHEHNQYLTAFNTAGIIGLISFLLLIWLPMLRFVRLWQTGLIRARYLGWCGLSAIILLAVIALSESLFERNNGVIWFGLLIALSAGLVQSRRRLELSDAPKRQHPVSVMIICRDEADRIERCLASVAGWADEIVVLDSGSSDDTVAICRRYTDRVEITDWPGFGRQKQRALGRTTSEWVLSLDADEVLSEELRREIDLVLAEDIPWRDGYYLPWLPRMQGRKLHHGRWTRSPLRLFRRRYAQFTPVMVHEKVILDGGCRVGHLEGPLYHDSYRDIAHARNKLEGYAKLQAREYLHAGKRAILPVIPELRALFRLFDNALLRGAFLDGRLGLQLACAEAEYVRKKYQELRRLTREIRQRSD